MYSDPVKKTVEREKRKLVKTARYEDVDTGRKKRTIIIEADGSETETLEAIKERVFKEAVYETVKESETSWVVTGEATGEEHNFATLEAANNFLNEVR